MVIRSILVSNKYTNATAASSELDYATYLYNTYSQEVTRLNDRITEYMAMITAIQPDVTITSSGAMIQNVDDNLKSIVDDFNMICNKRDLAKKNAEEWEEIKDAYTSATTPSTAIQEQINASVDAYNNAYVALQVIVDSYNEDNYASSLVSETKTVKTVKDSAISALIIVLVEVVVIAVIMVVIVAVEKKKEEKEKEAKQEVKA